MVKMITKNKIALSDDSIFFLLDSKFYFLDSNPTIPPSPPSDESASWKDL